MQIAIVGAGRIGSTFAYYLSRAGHEVTLVARGKRLEELQREPAIVMVDGERAAVKAAGSLDGGTPWDLVLVTVLAHQVDAVLPSLAASKAKTALFLFNSFDSPARLRDAVGAGRFASGFPTMIAFFEGEKLKSTVRGHGMVTTLSDATWAAHFAQAGLPTEVQPDMESFLRSHVAAVIPMMVVGCLAYERKGGVTWAEAGRVARAAKEGFQVVRRLGHSLIPGAVAMLSGLPLPALTFLLWASSRASAVSDLGKMGTGEVRALIDAVVAASPDTTKELQAIRP